MTTNVYLEKQAKKLKFVNFRGVTYPDLLSKLKPLDIECGILGSRVSTSNQTLHWTCWFKFKDKVYYFDSFGNNPDSHLINYFKPINMLISTFQIQHYNENNCGEWCLWFLNNMSKILKQNKTVNDENFIDLILSVINNSTF